jgi:Protein of unknown function (DUF3313)
VAAGTHPTATLLQHSAIISRPDFEQKAPRLEMEPIPTMCIFLKRTDIKNLYISTATVALLSGCVQSTLQPGGNLSSYNNLHADHGIVTKSLYYADKQGLAKAHTVRIEPTSIGPGSAKSISNLQDLRLVANAIDRSICTGLSDRFALVSGDTPADITVHATTIEIGPTNATIAGISTIASIGASAVTPVPVPRIPLGLGELMVEAEAKDSAGNQVAALVWSRGANIITEQARMSQVGDAYSLAYDFGNDFSVMLNRGGSPMNSEWIASVQKLDFMLGAKPKYVACEAFGRAPGVAGFVEGQLGMPPQWSDRSAPIGNGI